MRANNLLEKYITPEEMVLLHLYSFYRVKERFEAPVNMTCFGMARQFKTDQTKLLKILKKLKGETLITDFESYVVGYNEKKIVYCLTEYGQRLAEEIIKRLLTIRVKIKYETGEIIDVPLGDVNIVLGTNFKPIEILMKVSQDGVLDTSQWQEFAVRRLNMERM